MTGRLVEQGEDRLEGLCSRDSGRVRDGKTCIRTGPKADGIERIEVHLVDQAFSRHRHDTYAIGITLAGVQKFFYRGEQRCCLPGQLHILHPDEEHDGQAGTADGFGYRIAHVDPSRVQEALGGRSLPFVADPVVVQGRVCLDSLAALWMVEEPLGALEQIEVIAALADILGTLSGQAPAKSGLLPLGSLLRIRDLIAADPASPQPLGRLEAISGLDRWTLARRFRTAFGTSPSKFRTMRQLDWVRRLVRSGTPLAEAAFQAGFADQSHMSRMFKRTYGLTPAKWAAALA